MQQACHCHQLIRRIVMCARAGLSSPPVPIRIAFFNVEVCDSGLAVPDKALLHTIYGDSHSLKNYWVRASNKRAFLDESTSTVINLRLPCDRFPITNCDVGSWLDYASGNPAALGGAVLNQYQIQVSVYAAWCDAGDLHGTVCCKI